MIDISLRTLVFGSDIVQEAPLVYTYVQTLQMLKKNLYKSNFYYNIMSKLIGKFEVWWQYVRKIMYKKRLQALSFKLYVNNGYNNSLLTEGENNKEF